jgi:hypothetical protein
MVYGCSTEQANPPGSGASDEIGTQASDQRGVEVSGSPAPAGACDTTAAPGTLLQRVQLPWYAIGNSFSTNPAGEVAFSSQVAVGMNPDGSPILASGVTRLDAALNHVYDYLHGSVVALDAAGNAYVAGGFTEATDFGTGVMTPQGNIDAFVVKLSPTGEVLAVYDLEDCGSNVGDIAISADGRIAISGAEMGTVVLDANGDETFRSDAHGKLAFDAAGNLVIGGSYIGTLPGTSLSTNGAADANGFVMKLDAQGSLVFAHQYGDGALPVDVGGYGGFVTVSEPTEQMISDVAVGPDGNVHAIGTFYRQMQLNGVTAKEGSAFPSGTQYGTFFAQLDAAGNTVTEGPLAPANGGLLLSRSIAVSATGVEAISSNTPGNAQGPFAYPQLWVSGMPGFSLGNFTGYPGFGMGVGFDACGNVLWADNHNEPSILDSHTFISRLAN